MIVVPPLACTYANIPFMSLSVSRAHTHVHGHKMTQTHSDNDSSSAHAPTHKCIDVMSNSDRAVVFTTGRGRLTMSLARVENTVSWTWYVPGGAVRHVLFVLQQR